MSRESFLVVYDLITWWGVAYFMTVLSPCNEDYAIRCNFNRNSHNFLECEAEC